jgi:hypothetical protein
MKKESYFKLGFITSMIPLIIAIIFYFKQFLNEYKLNVYHCNTEDLKQFCLNSGGLIKYFFHLMGYNLLIISLLIGIISILILVFVKKIREDREKLQRVLLVIIILIDFLLSIFYFLFFISLLIHTY